MTLLELAIVVAILALALGEVSRSLLTVSRLEPVNRETALALDAASSAVESLRALPFAEVLARHGPNPADDPDGPGTAAGPHFAVAGLDARPDDPDGRAGRIELPTLGDELREDVFDRGLGMPRDLDGDGAIDGLDHSADHDVLPVRVVVEWTGATGERSIALVTTLSRPE